jgi:anthranilate phosphoribosyltransferase
LPAKTAGKEGRALKNHGVGHGWWITGIRLDEITITGRTHIFELKNGVITRYPSDPEDCGSPRMQTAKGGDCRQRRYNAVQTGGSRAKRDVVNESAAALMPRQSRDMMMVKLLRILDRRRRSQTEQFINNSRFTKCNDAS